MTNRIAQLSTIMAVLALAAAAEAVVVNIDIQPEGFPGHDPFSPQQTYTGLGAAPDDAANTFWNVFEMDNQGNTAESESGFLASDGVTQTNVGLTVGGNVGSFADNTHTEAAVPLMRDEAFTYSPTGTFWITGLTPGTPYDLYIYAGGRDETVGQGRTTSVWINEDTSTTQSTIAPDQSTTVLTLGEDYLVFSSVLVDASQQIRFDFGGQFSGAIQGLQVVEVPEPASLALLGLGGLALIRRRGN